MAVRQTLECSRDLDMALKTQVNEVTRLWPLPLLKVRMVSFVGVSARRRRWWTA